MINYSSNINVVVRDKLEKLQALRNNPDPILRAVALAVLPELKHRVHVQGKDSTGGQIGTYSPGYMVARTGGYKNADRVSRGENKGKLKNAGKVTKKSVQLYGYTGKKTFIDVSASNVNRQKYNRSGDTMVILSLTRQMENDMSVVPTGKGYGIGYLNPDNLKKARYCETTYKKKILTKLTTGELELARKTAQDFLPEYLKTL